MANIDQQPVFYATFGVQNTGISEGGLSQPILPAVIQQAYNTPIVNKANDYVMAIERLEVNLNGVPFYQALDSEQIKLTLIGDPNTNVAKPLKELTAWSLYDLIRILNSYMQNGTIVDNGGNGDLFKDKLQFSLDAEGFVSMSTTNYLTHKNYDFEFPASLNQVLGLEDAFPSDVTIQINNVTSRFPRFDCGDQLSYIRVVSNLPTVSDSVGQSKSNILTDLYFGLTFGASVTDPTQPTDASIRPFNWSPRQKVIYNPPIRRFLNLRSSAPINDIEISCEFVRPDGSSAPISLPRGCEFTLKIGFWNLKNLPTPRDPAQFNSRVINGQQMIVF